MLAFHNAYGRPGYTWPKGDLPKDAAYAALTPPAWSLAVQRTAVADIATLTATDTLGLAKGIALVITLSRHQPYVDVEWRVTDKTPDPMPEGGWLCFPFAVAQPQFLLGRLGGPIDPAKDIVAGANRHYFCLNTGLTITGQDETRRRPLPAGLALREPRRAGLVEVLPRLRAEEADGLRQPLQQRVEHQLSRSGRTAPGPAACASGPRRDDLANLVVPSWEARLPLLAAVADGPAGKLPPTQAGLSVSRPGVLVTAFGPIPTATGTLLRVWEQSGVSGELVVTLPAGCKTTRASRSICAAKRSASRWFFPAVR